MMSIGMKSRAIRRQAPGKANEPAGAKSRIAIAESPTISFVKALKRSFMTFLYYVTNVMKKHRSKDIEINSHHMIYIKIYLYKMLLCVVISLFVVLR